MKLFKTTAFFGLLIAAAALQAVEIRPVKYLFYFIGDGMGYVQRQLGSRYLEAVKAPPPVMESLPCAASTVTRSANASVTDSAAAGTALACGSKTNNGMLGLSPDGTPLESIAVVAQKSGRKVGILTTVQVNHATPAAFYGHRPRRSMYNALTEDLIASGFDFFGGAGLLSETGKSEENLKKCAAAGYRVARSADEVRALKPADGKILAVPPLPLEADRKDGEFSLAELTGKAVELLDNPKGFFLMVEGGRIDSGCHGNDPVTTLHEILAFDRAIAVAVEFARRHPEETLIVVTGDHETGGLDFTQGKFHPEILKGAKASSSMLAKKLALLQQQKGSKTFDQEGRAMLLECCGAPFLKSLTTGEATALAALFDNAMGSGNREQALFDSAKAAQSARSGFVHGVNKLLSQKAGLRWGTRGHSWLFIRTTAMGVNAKEVTTNAFGMSPEEREALNRIGVSQKEPVIDNTRLAQRLKRAMK